MTLTAEDIHKSHMKRYQKVLADMLRPAGKLGDLSNMKMDNRTNLTKTMSQLRRKVRLLIELVNSLRHSDEAMYKFDPEARRRVNRHDNLHRAIFELIDQIPVRQGRAAGVSSGSKNQMQNNHTSARDTANTAPKGTASALSANTVNSKMKEGSYKFSFDQKPRPAEYPYQAPNTNYYVPDARDSGLGGGEYSGVTVDVAKDGNTLEYHAPQTISKYNTGVAPGQFYVKDNKQIVLSLAESNVKATEYILESTSGIIEGMLALWPHHFSQSPKVAKVSKVDHATKTVTLNNPVYPTQYTEDNPALKGAMLGFVSSADPTPEPDSEYMYTLYDVSFVKVGMTAQIGSSGMAGWKDPDDDTLPVVTSVDWANGTINVDKRLHGTPIGEGPVYFTSPTPSGGSDVYIAKTAGLGAGMSITGSGIPSGTHIETVSDTFVTLSQPSSEMIPTRTPIAVTIPGVTHSFTYYGLQDYYPPESSAKTTLADFLNPPNNNTPGTSWTGMYISDELFADACFGSCGVDTEGYTTARRHKVVIAWSSRGFRLHEYEQNSSQVNVLVECPTDATSVANIDGDVGCGSWVYLNNLIYETLDKSNPETKPVGLPGPLKRLDASLPGFGPSPQTYTVDYTLSRPNKQPKNIFEFVARHVLTNQPLWGWEPIYKNSNKSWLEQLPKLQWDNTHDGRVLGEALSIS